MTPTVKWVFNIFSGYPGIHSHTLVIEGPANQPYIARTEAYCQARKHIVDDNLRVTLRNPEWPEYQEISPPDPEFTMVSFNKI